VADPGIDGRGVREGVWGLGLPGTGSGGSGRAPAGRSGGPIPQKLKPKNGLVASRNAFGDVECQVCPSEPTLNLCTILVLVGILQPVCRPLNLLEYRPKTEYHTGSGKIGLSASLLLSSIQKVLLYCSL